MHISFDIDPIILILAGISLALSIIYILWEYIDLRSLKGSVNTSDSLNMLNRQSSCAQEQGVSVIVFSDNNAINLAQNLPHILSQDYPLFEVIVVNDGKNEEINDYLERMSLDYENLHHSYTPDDARNLSRKKLALMIGIKAAKYDIILTTNANCKPQSDKWIASIARHFSAGAEVVIGHSRILDGTDNKNGKLLRSFLTLRNSIKYLVQAINAKPYRGTSNNLAYSKELFFKNKGFSRSMHLHYGEDDLFINEIATHENTHVEISPESVMIAHFDNPARMFQILKLRHTFTERKIRSSAFLKESLKSLVYIANPLVAIVMLILGYTNAIVIAIPVLLAILTIIPQIIIYRKTTETLQARKLMLTVPVFTFIQPVINCYYKLKSRRHTSYNYTWQPLKN